MSSTSIVQQRLQSLRASLCSTPDIALFAILDCAVDESLYGHLQLEPASTRVLCLYDGDPGIRYARYAPYLVQLHAQSPLCEAWLREGWLHHWGIFLGSPAEPEVLKRHLKRFLTFQDQGKTAWLRFYDPRVLRTLLPALSPGHCHDFFGNGVVSAYAAPSAASAFWKASSVSEGLMRQMAGAGKLQVSEVNIGASR